MASGRRSPSGSSLATMVGTGLRPASAGRAGDQPAVDEDGRGHAPDQVADLGQGLAGLVAGVGDEGLGRRRVVIDALGGQPELHGQHDQPLLGAVVQVALDAPQLGRLDIEDGLAADLQGLDPCLQRASLGHAQQPGHDRAMEGHQAAGHDRGHDQEHGPARTPAGEQRPARDAEPGELARESMRRSWTGRSPTR